MNDVQKNITLSENTNKFYKWEVLGLLWFAFFINQADRQIYNTLLGPISESLNLTTADAGLISTLFSLVFATLGPISGVLADRYSKKWIVVGSIILWSVATIISGSCAGLIGFIVFRSIATGAGEAFFAPANYATIAEYHDNKTRARAMSIHQTSYYFGVIVSGALAGWIADIWGWRSAFYVFGSIGVFFGLYMIWRLKDKPKDISELSTKVERPSFWESLKMLFKVKTALCMTLSFASLIFVLQGYLTWSTMYLQEKFPSMSLAEAGFSAMFYTHVFAFIGVLVAGWLSDFLARKKAQYIILLQSIGLLLASPFIVLMGMSSTMTIVYIGFAGFGFFRAFFDANTYSVLYDVIPQKYHASAAGVMLSLGFSIGSFSPWILGKLEPLLGLSNGL
ncbi:MAG: MFS transporter, partial [Opitutales bacterium]|nr:MFS transporter [Opitutales bacterium]